MDELKAVDENSFSKIMVVRSSKSEFGCAFVEFIPVLLRSFLITVNLAGYNWKSRKEEENRRKRENVHANEDVSV